MYLARKTQELLWLICITFRDFCIDGISHGIYSCLLTHSTWVYRQNWAIALKTSAFASVSCIGRVNVNDLYTHPMRLNTAIFCFLCNVFKVQHVTSHIVMYEEENIATYRSEERCFKRSRTWAVVLSALDTMGQVIRYISHQPILWTSLNFGGGVVVELKGWEGLEVMALFPVTVILNYLEQPPALNCQDNCVVVRYLWQLEM